MQDLLNKKVLITTSNWFYAPDGKQYKAVHGTLQGIHEAGKALGFIPNRSHANWFIQIGQMTIMGCQVMYVIQCETINGGEVESWVEDNAKPEVITTFLRPSTIYQTT
ncbi:hypothetical protein QEG73_22015 [Chitinophagaceae bacterium 26-R-25]|nr:hypothetical protein [Chitinophagaceae bacterium 26-R-25]